MINLQSAGVKMVPFPSGKIETSRTSPVGTLILTEL
jgi:hypothetical protein